MRTKNGKGKEAISARIVKRGTWRSNPTYRDVSDEVGYSLLDIHVMNAYDSLVAAGGATFWQMKATSNGGFFLFPEKKEKTVEILSPNGHRARVSIETSGIVATLITLKRVGRGVSAYVAILRLLQYAKQQPAFPVIFSLITGL